MSDEMADKPCAWFEAAGLVQPIPRRESFWLHPQKALSDLAYGPTPDGTYLRRNGEFLTLYQVRANGRDGYIAFDSAKVRAYQRPRTRAACRRVARGVATREDFEWLRRVGAGSYWLQGAP